jgi:penicillin-binding protein 1A
VALKIACPHCSHPHRLSEPYPDPGSEVQCGGCGAALAITYPVGLVDRLRAKGARFLGDPAPTPSPVIATPAPEQLHRPTPAPPKAPPRPAPRPAPHERPPLTPIGHTGPLDPDHERTVMQRRVAHEADPTSPIDDTGADHSAPMGGYSAGTGPTVMGQAPSSPRPPAPAPPRRSRLKTLGLGTLGLAALGALTFAGTWAWFAKDLPGLDTLASYRPPTVTIVYDNKGQVLGEIYEQRRYVVPLADMPEHLPAAFIASEDANFWNHKGVDPMGIARAMVVNVQEGGMSQGASTITQQVSRNFLLTSEKKLSRKIKEAILATRVEKAFDKEHILHLYLNEIYLGSGAYGVEAAARIYFDKHVQDLTLAEAAILAGLPQRPSDYSPHKNWDKAKARQTYVLRQMLEKGFIDQAAHDAALAEEIRVVKTDNPIRKLAPYYTEHVRRHLVETYGFDRVYNEGLIVHTTCDLDLQQVAQTAVTEGITDADAMLGWRGPNEHIEASAIEARLAAQEASMRDVDQFLADNARRNDLPAVSTLREGERFEAVVTHVEKKHAIVGIGSHSAIIPLSWTAWGFEPNTQKSWRYRTNDSMENTLAVGDVVTVTVEAVDSQTVGRLEGYEPAVGKAAAKLYQKPELQGALLSYDLDTGAVRAMVGGVDIEESEFNRAIQSKRQVGSTFKPIVYATAIAEKKFTTGSLVPDTPKTFFDYNEEKIWKPGNYGGDFLGNISLRKALALSRNVCTVHVLDVIGMDPVYDTARSLGIESHLEKDMSMGLGTSSLSMIEMARAYSVFATYGTKVEPYFIESVEDRDGVVLEEHQPAVHEQVMDPTVAGITTWLLREVATAGTAAKTNALGVHVAGKTGTTNDFKDAWFVGFSPGVITAAWAGYDTPRSMGTSSTGGRIALPMWMEYMKAAWPKEIDRDFPEIPDAQWASIDESTGKVRSGGRGMPFVAGTVPERSGAGEGQVSSEDFLTGGM